MEKITSRHEAVMTWGISVCTSYRKELENAGSLKNVFHCS